MSKADQKMLKDMAQANLAEISLGKVALTKSQDPRVKEFAQKMIDDHTMALKDLQQIAQNKGVMLPTEPDSKHKAMLTKMEQMSSSTFDKRYMAQGGLSDHQQTHQLLQRVESKAKDPELKAAARKTDPIVQEHLASAKQIQKEQKAGQTSSGGSGTSGTSKNSPGGTSGSTGTGASGGMGSSGSTGTNQ